MSGNLRQAQPLTNDQLLQDRYDSVFRRNLVEPNEAIYDHRRNKHKKEHKFWKPVGTKTKELAKENAKRAAKNDELEKGVKGQLASDLIMI